MGPISAVSPSGVSVATDTMVDISCRLTTTRFKPTTRYCLWNGGILRIWHCLRSCRQWLLPFHTSLLKWSEPFPVTTHNCSPNGGTSDSMLVQSVEHLLRSVSSIEGLIWSCAGEDEQEHEVGPVRGYWQSWWISRLSNIWLFVAHPVLPEKNICPPLKATWRFSLITSLPS